MPDTAVSVSVASRPSWLATLLSVLLIVAGLAAIVLPLAAGLAVNILVAWMLLFGAFVHFALAWHKRSVWQALLGVVYGVIGIYLLLRPLQGLETLTLALAIYLFLESGLEFALSYAARGSHGAGWLVFDGVVTFILALMILATWPFSSGWIIGTLIGISLIFSGFARLMHYSAGSGAAKPA